MRPLVSLDLLELIARRTDIARHLLVPAGKAETLTNGVIIFGLIERADIEHLREPVKFASAASGSGFSTNVFLDCFQLAPLLLGNKVVNRVGDVALDVEGLLVREPGVAHQAVGDRALYSILDRQRLLGQLADIGPTQFPD